MATTVQVDSRCISTPTARSRRGYYVAKRAFDLCVASLAIAVTLPLWIVIAIAIRVDSPGPVLFRQERVRGRRIVAGGKTSWQLTTFPFYKFRTMYVADHDDVHREYMTAYITNDHDYFSAREGGYSPGESYRRRDDPRVTRVGRVLRKLSLDELPQLWNVLVGHMSIVGPRPPMPYEVDLYDDIQVERLAAPGGITGLAQINGRCTIGFDDVVRHDREYIERQSFWQDLTVIARTVPAVLSRKGAD